MLNKICLISEALSEPLDEGVKIFTFSLLNELSKKTELFAVTRDISRIKKSLIEKVRLNKLFMNRIFHDKIKAFSPDTIIYIPEASATVAAFLRAKILSMHVNKCKIVLIALQPRLHSLLGKLIIRLLGKNLLLLAPSKQSVEYFRSQGFNAEHIFCGIDAERYVPVEPEAKKALRNKYTMPDDKFIVLHVGHIKKNRNIQELKNIQRIKGMQVLCIGSTSTMQEECVKKDLLSSGIKITDSYLDNIQEAYQMADCYIFPTNDDHAAIEVPLSVLEAMACNLPVLTTKFGGLIDMFKEGNGFLYYSGADELLEKLHIVRSQQSQVNTRGMVTRFSWDRVSRDLLAAIRRYHEN